MKLTDQKKQTNKKNKHEITGSSFQSSAAFLAAIEGREEGAAPVRLR